MIILELIIGVQIKEEEMSKKTVMKMKMEMILLFLLTINHKVKVQFIWM